MISRLHLRPHVAGWTLVAAVALLVGMEGLLATSDLWETSDTYCRTLLAQDAVGGICTPVVRRRLHWVIVIGIITLVLLALAIYLLHREFRWPPLLAIPLLLIAIGCGLYATASVTIGDDGFCGSTLSRILGTSAAANSPGCGPTYAHQRRDAWLAGVPCVALLLAVPLTDAALGGRRRHAGSLLPAAPRVTDGTR